MKKLVVLTGKALSNSILWTLAIVILGFAILFVIGSYAQGACVLLAWMFWFLDIPGLFIATCQNAAKAPFPLPYFFWIAGAACSIALIDSCLVGFLELTKHFVEMKKDNRSTKAKSASSKSITTIQADSEWRYFTHYSSKNRLWFIAACSVVMFFCWHATIRPAMREFNSWAKHAQKNLEIDADDY